MEPTSEYYAQPEKKTKQSKLNPFHTAESDSVWTAVNRVGISPRSKLSKKSRFTSNSKLQKSSLFGSIRGLKPSNSKQIEQKNQELEMLQTIRDNQEK